jgi:hypothetical protein
MCCGDYIRSINDDLRASGTIIKDNQGLLLVEYSVLAPYF